MSREWRGIQLKYRRRALRTALPPYVPEADSETETRKEKLYRIVPLSPLTLLLPAVIRMVKVLAQEGVVLPHRPLHPAVQGGIAAVLQHDHWTILLILPKVVLRVPSISSVCVTLPSTIYLGSSDVQQKKNSNTPVTIAT